MLRNIVLDIIPYQWCMWTEQDYSEVGPHDRSRRYVWKVFVYLQNYTVSHTRRQFKIFIYSFQTL